MTDVTIVIPTIYDYLADIVTGVPFWAAIGVMAVTTIGLSRIYRRRRGWY
jgi:hypothetical protein